MTNLFQLKYDINTELSEEDEVKKWKKINLLIETVCAKSQKMETFLKHLPLQLPRHGLYILLKYILLQIPIYVEAFML